MGILKLNFDVFFEALQITFNCNLNNYKTAILTK